MKGVSEMPQIERSWRWTTLKFQIIPRSIFGMKWWLCIPNNIFTVYNIYLLILFTILMQQNPNTGEGFYRSTRRLRERWRKCILRGDNWRKNSNPKGDSAITHGSWIAIYVRNSKWRSRSSIWSWHNCSLTGPIGNIS